jgi:hypothetical protein
MPALTDPFPCKAPIKGSNRAPDVLVEEHPLVEELVFAVDGMLGKLQATDVEVVAAKGDRVLVFPSTKVDLEVADNLPARESGSRFGRGAGVFTGQDCPRLVVSRASEREALVDPEVHQADVFPHVHGAAFSLGGEPEPHEELRGEMR